MPKEIVHWRIAELAREKLREDGFLRKIINKYYSEYLIGSIAFDIPYYDFFSSDTEKIAEIGSKLHGHGLEFAQTHYNEILKYYGVPLPEYVLAFIAGSFCHAITDIFYHPVVIYHVKDSVKEHRQFETNLDLYYLGETETSICKLLNRIKTEKKNFETLVSLFIFGKYNARVSLILLKYKFLQFAIRKKCFYYIVKTLNFLLKNKFSDILPLFYKNFKKQSSFLS